MAGRNLFLAGKRPGGRPAAATEAAQQHVTRRRVAEQRENELAMAVELRRGADDGHHAVGLCEVEEIVDVGVGEPSREGAKAQLRLELGSQPGTPGGLVGSKRRGLEPVGA
jgi:hypothetical protein